MRDYGKNAISVTNEIFKYIEAFFRSIAPDSCAIQVINERLTIQASSASNEFQFNIKPDIMAYSEVDAIVGFTTDVKVVSTGSFIEEDVWFPLQNAIYAYIDGKKPFDIKKDRIYVYNGKITKDEIKESGIDDIIKQINEMIVYYCCM